MSDDVQHREAAIARFRRLLTGWHQVLQSTWLSGLVVAHYLGRKPLAPGLSRSMLMRNIDHWLAIGSLNERNILRERLTPDGSDGGRDTYINCGHPYWEMQSFLCLAFPEDHPFWQEPGEKLPVENGDFQLARSGPGFVLQGLQRTGEVRLFNTRNLNHRGNALYEKFVYSSAFPCNSATTAHLTFWDNQFGLRLADGSHVGPAEILSVNVTANSLIELAWRFTLPPDFTATIRTSIHLEGESYRTDHKLQVEGEPPPGAQWVEGGFTLGFSADEEPRCVHEENIGRAVCGERAINTESLIGWDLHDCESSRGLAPASALEPAPNIIDGRSVHFLLTAPGESRGRPSQRKTWGNAARAPILSVSRVAIQNLAIVSATAGTKRRAVRWHRPRRENSGRQLAW